MNKVINGKMYDTKKAEIIKVYRERIEVESKDIEKGEILYKKSNSEYFKEVIDYTLYSEYFNEEFFDYLIPLSFEEARKWLEKYGTGDEYVKEFGEVDE